MVIWNGAIGGAESVQAELAWSLRTLGVNASVLFVGDPEPLAERLRHAGTPYATLGLARGRQILRSARRYARTARELGRDGTLLEERGLMCLALRAGGYRAPTVAIEHGSLLLDERARHGPSRMLRAASRAASTRTLDAEVAVSDFMLARMRQSAHGRRTLRIHNGIDPDRYHPPHERHEHARLRVGVAGRLVPGKGIAELIGAVAHLDEQAAVELLVAGEGPEAGRLEELAGRLAGPSRVRFMGFVQDIAGFWRQCDVAVIPSSSFVESFSMTTLEAMACGCAIVASRNGAIPELMIDGETGTLVGPGDTRAIANALAAYARSPSLRDAHGLAARRRAVEQFHIKRTAHGYLSLLAQLGSWQAR